MEAPPSNPEGFVQFPDIASEINAMVEVDQQMREKAMKEGIWDESIDAANTARMKEIIAEIGWPTISRVGTRPSFNAWLLVQHADRDVDFQEECLNLMKHEPPTEIDLRNIAMLEDRIRVNRNQPQIYGTQFRQIDGEHIPLSIEDEENVDERRTKMGLDTLKENITRMYQKYGAPEQG